MVLVIGVGNFGYGSCYNHSESVTATEPCKTVREETVLMWAARAADEHERKAPRDSPVKQKVLCS